MILSIFPGNTHHFSLGGDELGKPLLPLIHAYFF
jgi:hypothetical protein